MKKIKVIHISRGFEDYVLSLVNTLSEHVDLHVALASADQWMANEMTSQVKVFFTRAPRVSDPKNIFSLIRLISFIRKNKPDVIHLQNGVVWEALLPIFIRNVKFVTTIHDVTRHPTRKKLGFTPQGLLDFLVRKSDAIILHSETLKRYAINHYGQDISCKKIGVIPHGVIERYGSGSARVETDANVLFFGSIDEWKGIEHLIKAEPIIRERIPNLKIKISGKASDKEYYSNLIGTGQHIEMDLDRQSNEKIRELFLWADVLVLPYIEASQSGVLNLGINYSLPAVVTNVGGLPDVITNERNGLVVPPRDEIALAEAVCDLLTNKKLRIDIIKNLDADKCGAHGRIQIATDTYDLYSELIDKFDCNVSSRWVN